MISIKDDIVINKISTNEYKAIKEVISNDNKFNNVNIVDANRITNFKDIVKSGECFFQG